MNARGKGRRASLAGLAVLLVAAGVIPTGVGVAHAATASLAEIIDTSTWSPASPGPAGVVYVAASDRLIVVDSDRNNFPEWNDGDSDDFINLWEYSLTTDTVVSTGVLTFDEPTGVDLDPATGTLFVSSDSDGGVYVIDPGGDGFYGTGDDSTSFINAGVGDAEDPAFDPVSGHLFFLDGGASTIYEIDPVDSIFANGNDTTSSFSIGGLGPTDWEGLAYDATTDHLLAGAKDDAEIYEITKTGSLVDVIDASGIVEFYLISGLGVQPNGGGGVDYWVADRGDTLSEDGRLLRITTGPVGPTPPVAHPQSLTTPTNVAIVGIVLDATDVNGDPLTYSIVDQPTDGALTGTEPNVTYTPDTDFAGADSFTFRANDGSEDSNIATISIGVGNQAPVLDPIAPQVIDEGAALAFTATATDPEADAMTFTLEGTVPPGAMISTGGAFAWTPTESQGPDNYEITVRVTDDGSPNQWSAQVVSVTVNEVNTAPNLTEKPSGLEHAEGESVTVNVGWSDADLPVNSISWQATGLPSGISINPTTGQLTGILNNGTSAASPHAVTITATDDGTPPLDDVIAFNWTVVLTNLAPTLDAIGDRSVTEENVLAFTATASDPELHALTFSLIGAPSGATIKPAGLFTWIPTSLQGPGTYDITIRVTDDGTPNRFDEETITVTVIDVFGSTFDDDDGSVFEADIEWMVAEGITSGCNAEGTLFCPNDAVTRAQMATFLVEAFDLPPVEGNRFTDVSGVHLANINAVAEASITVGCNTEGTEFCPNDLVSRAQMGTFLAKALGLAEIAGDVFLDVSGVHEGNINAIAAVEITLGCNAQGTLY